MAYFFKSYVDQYGADKTREWADQLLRHFRTYSQPLIDPAVAEKNMNLILSRFDMQHVLKMFKDPAKLKTAGWEVMPMAIMEKIRNILIGERVEAGITVNLNSLDAAAEADRQNDKKLLKNRNKTENLISYLNKQIGLPPYKLADETKSGNPNPFKGNTDMFDALGLDSNSDFHIAYFFQVWHRLLNEMDGQQLINYLFEYNELKENIDKWTNDILAKKRIAMQVYVNDLTGALEARYLAPERISLIPGKRKDGKDAIVIHYEEQTTVSEMLKRMGRYVDLDRDWQHILLAVNFYNKSEYTGIFDGMDAARSQYQYIYGNGGKDNATGCAMSDFMNFKVSVGYGEWKSWDRKIIKSGKNYFGNTALYIYKGEQDKDALAKESTYTKEADYLQYTFYAWYLPTSTLTQHIVDWGKVPYQTVEGAEDIYSNYSIILRIESGPTVAEVAQPFIELAQEAFTKFRWMVRRAKPKGRVYNYESMVKIATKMYGTGDKITGINAVLKLFEEGINELYTIPTDAKGERIGGGPLPNVDLPNGLDPTAIQFKDIIDWAVTQIKDGLAITQLREAYNPKPNDGLGLQQETKKSSEHATNYINDMLDGLMENTAQRFLLSIIDIVNYKATLPYSFLQGIMGDAGINRFKALDKIAFHRYGIFINGFSTFMDRQQVKIDTQQAFQNKEITYDVKILVDSIDDYRKAAYILAFEKRRAMMEEQQQIQQEHNNAMQLAQMQHAFKMEEINAEGTFKNKDASITGYWNYQTQNAVMSQKSGMQVEKFEHEGDKIEQKTEADIQILQREADLKKQTAIPAA